MTTMLLLSLFLFTLSSIVHGFPKYWVDGNKKTDLSTVVAGTTPNPMKTSETFIAGATGNNCVVELWTTPLTFAATTKYKVTVKASTASAFVLQASQGTFTASSSELTIGDKITNTKGADKSTTHTFWWNSPSAGTVNFYAVCIVSDNGPAYVASTKQTTFNSAAVPPLYCKENCETCTGTTSSSTCTKCKTDYTLSNGVCSQPQSPSPSTGNGDTKLHDDLSVSSVISSDKSKMEFTLTSKRNAWVAFGVTSTNGGMNAGGSGSDVMICVKGSKAKRYNIKAKSKPTNGVTVDDSSCTFSSGGVVMKFTRKISASDNKELALTPGKKQSLIWAMGSSGDISLSSIHAARSEVSLDVGALNNGGAATNKKKETNLSLWLHIICMGSAWGLILPWGVSIANRSRNVNKDTHPGGWFWLHKNLQYTGWFIQLLGFIFVLIYVSNNSAHFSNPHTIIGLVVVILGTLQPLNAYFRPHTPKLGETKSKNRQLWEYLHKGSGWIAVVVGMINVIFGALLTSKKEYRLLLLFFLL
jgi:hypothetical protein